MARKKARASRRLACRKCGELKSREDFVKDRGRANGVFPWCKTCHVTSQIAYRRKKVDGDGSGERFCEWCEKDISGTHWNRKYCSSKCKDQTRRVAYFGMTPKEHKALIASNKGKCPICMKNVRSRWNVDHNHDTGLVMGAVCTGCNVGVLAHVNHDIATAKRLVEFLESPPAVEMFGERRFVGPVKTSNLDRMWLWEKEERKQ